MFVLTPGICSPAQVAGEAEFPGKASAGCLGLFQDRLYLLHPSNPARALQLAGLLDPKMAEAGLPDNDSQKLNFEKHFSLWKGSDYFPLLLLPPPPNYAIYQVSWTPSPPKQVA